MFKRTCFQS